jgi:hypothetical protein
VDLARRDLREAGGVRGCGQVAIHRRFAAPY